MDELDGPVLGDYPDDPRLALLTLAEARDVVRLLQAVADGTADDDDVYEARQLAGEIAFRIPSA
ncbi:hypothetical protein ACIBCO_35795 [Streptomyces violascens]|uniref:hypothetical protein n=1 Tax=Streptomyces violascens TaxID=67381 RepID=UPI0037A027DE